MFNCIPEKEVVQVLRRLVRIPSECYKKEEKGVIVAVKGLLEDWGISAKLQSLNSGETGRFNVVASFGESEKPVLLLNTHADTAPAAGMSVNPFGAVLSRGRVYGRGACDNKAGIVAGIFALKALHEAGIELEGKFVFTAVSDENGQQLGVTDIMNSDIHPKWGIVSEPTGNRVVVAHRGRMDIVITVKGMAAHSGSPQLGRNAILAMAKLVVALDQGLKSKFAGKYYAKYPVLRPSFNISVVQGGVTQNLVPAECKIMIDRRITPGETPRLALQEIQDIVLELTTKDAGLDVLVEEFKNEDQFATCPLHTPLKLMPPFKGRKQPIDVPTNQPIVTAAREACKKVLGKDLGISVYGGHTAADAFNNIARVPTIVLGPGESEQSFSPNEYVLVSSVVEGARIYAATVMNLLSQVRRQ